MTLKQLGSEKRLHPRIEHQLPVRIAANGYNFSTSTQNVSVTGAYCHIEKYVPPFTKIGVNMTLPLVKKNKKEEAELECRGVIVRTDDALSGGFNIAIFFNGITGGQRKKISEYISQFLP